MDGFYGKPTIVGKRKGKGSQDIVRELTRVECEFEGDGLADAPVHTTSLPR